MLILPVAVLGKTKDKSSARTNVVKSATSLVEMRKNLFYE